MFFKIKGIARSLSSWIIFLIWSWPWVSVIRFTDSNTVYLWLTCFILLCFCSFEKGGYANYFIIHLANKVSVTFVCMVYMCVMKHSQTFLFFLAFDFCRFRVVIQFFSSPPQRPMTSDFEGFSIPDFIHYIYFSYLNSWFRSKQDVLMAVFKKHSGHKQLFQNITHVVLRSHLLHV